jgi:hypothetical protein
MSIALSRAFDRHNFGKLRMPHIEGRRDAAAGIAAPLRSDSAVMVADLFGNRVFL